MKELVKNQDPSLLTSTIDAWYQNDIHFYKYFQVKL